VKYRVILSPVVIEEIRHFSPLLKKKVRAALTLLEEDPHSGKSLRDELQGFWSFRVDRYRIVYRIRHRKVQIEVIDVGLRSVIYEQIVQSLERSD
jgi:mRNA-degrading endonuclease RelE of RelBE toxin-antitoxin system